MSVRTATLGTSISFNDSEFLQLISSLNSLLAMLFMVQLFIIYLIFFSLISRLHHITSLVKMKNDPTLGLIYTGQSGHQQWFLKWYLKWQNRLLNLAFWLWARCGLLWQLCCDCDKLLWVVPHFSKYASWVLCLKVFSFSSNYTIYLDLLLISGGSHYLLVTN